MMVGLDSTSLRACLYPLEACAVMTLERFSNRDFMSRRWASAQMYVSSSSLVKPGPAMTRQRTIEKSTWRRIAWRVFSKNLFTALSYPAMAAPRLRGMLVSTFARITVQLPPTSTRWASPSWTRHTARSALAAGSQDSLMRCTSSSSHSSLWSVTARLGSSSRVWYAPSLTCSFSTAFCPRTRICATSASYSTASAMRVSFTLTRSESIPPAPVSRCTLRNELAVTWSPRATRL
mmetsp:Transcript_71086/g.224783  ORF Transcript_71086/g.224783 Transcript_71086/m.224783 type:complete len:234 (-) Transcript_71086:489-1190(-)